MPSHHTELYRYWDTARGARAPPTRSDLDPTGIVKLLPFIGLIEHRQDGYYWRLVGTSIAQHMGTDVTGKRYGDGFSPAAFVAMTQTTFDAALEVEAPFFDELLYRSSKGSFHAVSRLICPLAADASHPPMVIHTRIHSSPDKMPVTLFAGRAWGERHDRWQIFSREDVQLHTEEW